MKSQERRDEEAVTIFAGLMVFLLAAAVGVLALMLANQFVAVNGAVLHVLAYAVLGCALVASIRYVYRHRGGR